MSEIIGIIVVIVVAILALSLLGSIIGLIFKFAIIIIAAAIIYRLYLNYKMNNK